MRTLLSAALLITATAAAVAGTKLPTLPSHVPELSAGEIAEHDVKTIFELRVSDPTALARQNDVVREGIAVYRFDPTAADAAVRDLETGFVSARAAFQKAISTRFGLLPLGVQVVQSDDAFREFCQAWAVAREGFTPRFALMQAWALQLPDDQHLAPLVERLRAVMATRYIRAEDISVAAVRSEPLAVRMVETKRSTSSLTLADVEKNGVAFDRVNFCSLEKARDDIHAGLMRGDFQLARYLMALVRPNTFFEPELTRSYLQARSNAPVRVDIYTQGQLVVRGGDLVTLRTVAALAALKEKIATSTADQIAQAEAAVKKQESLEGVLTPGSGSPSRWMYWALLVFMPLTIAVMAIGIVFLALRKQRPEVSSSLALQEQALENAAERSSSPVVDALRHSAVQRLYAQRQQLLAQQNASSTHVESLESRLAKLQPQLQERIMDYEARIEQLERELTQVREENRDLISHQIEQVRIDRDAELARAGIRWS